MTQRMVLLPLESEARLDEAPVGLERLAVETVREGFATACRVCSPAGLVGVPAMYNPTHLRNSALPAGEHPPTCGNESFSDSFLEETGVADVSINPVSGLVRVRYDDTRTDLDTVRGLLARHGYATGQPVADEESAS